MNPPLFLLAALLVCCWTVSARTFYLSEKGDDSHNGLSKETAWKSLKRVSETRFTPGDVVLLQGGGEFTGVLKLTKEDTGSEGLPVTIGSFAAGRAKILAGGGAGIEVVDVEYLKIKDLIVAGSGPTNNTAFGIHIENTSSNRMLKEIHLDSVEVEGFGKHGIMMTGQTHGFENITVTRSAMHRNLRGGLEIAGKLNWDAPNYAHKNVLVSECVAYDNPGDPAFSKNHSGSGLVLYQVDGGKIEKSAAWNNGELCPAAGGGPVGIWTCASRKVVIEYCESFGNRTRGLDGGGFDIDGGSIDCVLQYNYSHHNEGPGLMVYTYPYASHRDSGNIVRFNVSLDDAVTSTRYGGLFVRADGKAMSNVLIYNNTVITSGHHAALIVSENVEAVISNNIFLSGTNGLPLKMEGDPGMAVKFRQNLYWRSQSPFAINWNGKEISSLAEFRKATGQETFESAPFGLWIDPKLNAALPQSGPLKNLRLLAGLKPAETQVLKGGARIGLPGTGSFLDLLGNNHREVLPLGAIGDF